jgi:predicted metalloprotease with PDZ domain
MNSLKLHTLTAVILFAVSAKAQNKKSPQIDYILTVDTTDLSGYNVEMQIHNAPHIFKLALATHHEYDDRFWRFVQNFNVTVPNGNASFVKSDSALWQVSVSRNTATICYKIKLPQQAPHFAHRPFLSSLGGLVGDIHSFMYMPDVINIVSRVTFYLPKTWQIATGLEPTNKSNVFTASSAETLLDCPVLIGHLRKWHFTVNNVSHTIAYLPVANAAQFDSSTFVNNIKTIVQQAVKIFNGMPYKHFIFLLEDGENGAMEHHNSVTLGAPSSMLATNMKELYEELAHEFFHTWNLMSIKPAEYTPLNYGPQQTSAGLWFSEGFTMFYADLLLRRAGLPLADSADSTRITHLQSLMTRYYSDTGNTVIAPGNVSLASNAPPGMLGDYNASVHLQGELLGSMLDLMIRDASDSKRNLNDVMKLMFKRFHDKGFYAADVEQAVKDICLCNNDVHSFFKDYIYNGNAIDFNIYLKLAGLQFQLTYASAKNNEGQPEPDLPVYVWQPIGDSLYHIAVRNPVNCFTRAGIHTGDIVIALNNKIISKRQDFYSLLNTLHIDDKLWVTTKRDGRTIIIPVIITGYDKPIVKIKKLNNSSPQQQRLLELWEEGN